MAHSRAHVQRIWAITAPSLWAVIVFFMHVIHVDQQRVSTFKIPHADKIVHLTFFLVLAFLISRAQKLFYPNAGRLSVLFALIICAVYGGVLEWLQSQLENNRMSDWKDWLADVAGACIGVLLARKKILSIFFGHQVGKAHQDFL